MQKNKTSAHFYIFHIFIVLIAFLLQYNTVFSLKIGGANPMLPLAVCIVFSMFSGELNAVIFSLIVGVITDGAAATPICFNTITFMIFSLAVSLIVQHLFNNNIRSAVVLSMFTAFVYYIIRFIVSFPKQSLENAVGFFLRYILPSVIYTTLIIIPLYFLEKRIFGKHFVR